MEQTKNFLNRSQTVAVAAAVVAAVAVRSSQVMNALSFSLHDMNLKLFIGLCVPAIHATFDH